MTDFKGRHLGFLALLCGTWVAARIATGFLPDGSAVEASNVPEAVAPAIGRVEPQGGAAPSPIRNRPACCGAPLWTIAAQRARPRTTNRALPTVFRSSASFEPFTAPVHSRTDAAPLHEPIALTRPLRQKRLADIYAYSFWRLQGPGQGLAAGGQYGGSQSGLIAAIDVMPGAPRLLMRAAVAHDNLSDREFAVGARWQPDPAWPVSVTAERRFRRVGPDSFALYVAGGRGDIGLPAGFTLETYAQAGIVSDRASRYFFDAQARADRRILRASPVPIHIGGGVWTGGQRGIMRLDIGPSLRTDIAAGPIRIRATADWRFRIAGDAVPGNGPALTLSTGF